MSNSRSPIQAILALVLSVLVALQANELCPATQGEMSLTPVTIAQNRQLPLESATGAHCAASCMVLPQAANLDATWRDAGMTAYPRTPASHLQPYALGPEPPPPRV